MLAQAAPAGTRLRILLVEDDADLRQALAAVLSDSGYNVDAFACGGAALTAADDRAYTLAVVDLGLPDIDGISLIRNWRAQERQFPVLAITARPDAEARIEARQAGATDCLIKPFSLDELEASIDVLLRQR